MRQDYKFQLLAPSQMRGNHAFGRSRVDEQLYDHRLASLQQLRGRVYVKDGAIQPWELDDDERFCMRGDEQSWHFLLIDGEGVVVGCARYLLHPNTVHYDQLRVRHSALANDPRWGDKVRSAVEMDLLQARAENLSYVEIGGWALAEEWRGTRAALEILVASYALGQLWGGCLGSCTATVRHGSASILRKIGGVPFCYGSEVLPQYEDANYGCSMELIRFDSRAPSARFVPFIEQLEGKLSSSVAITTAATDTWKVVPGEVGSRAFDLMRMSTLCS